MQQVREDQSTLNSYAYSPYGQSVTSGSDEGNSVQYTARENDGVGGIANNGITFHRNRYYDAVAKVWLSEDPIGPETALNGYQYVDGDPISGRDPEDLWAIGDPLPQWVVDGAAGLGDGASFGGSRLYREWRGIDGGVDMCSPIYQAAEFAGTNIGPLGRLGYIARGKGLSRGVGSLEDALAKSAQRNALKREYRGGGWFANRFSDYKTREQVLVKYGTNPAEIAAAAGRTNPYFNSLAATGFFANSVTADRKACSCRN